MSTSESYDIMSPISGIDLDMNFDQLQQILDDNVHLISSIVDKLSNDEDSTGSLQEFYDNYDDIIKCTEEIPVDDVPKVETASTHTPQSSPLHDYPYTTEFETEPISLASTTEDNQFDEVGSLNMESHTATYMKVNNYAKTSIPPLVTRSSKLKKISRKTQKHLLYLPAHTQNMTINYKKIAKAYPNVQVFTGSGRNHRFKDIDMTSQQTFNQPSPKLMPHYFNQQPPMMTSNGLPPFAYDNPWYNPDPYNWLNLPQQAQMENSHFEVPLPIMHQVPIPYPPQLIANSSVSPLFLPTAADIYFSPFINSSMCTFPGSGDAFR